MKLKITLLIIMCVGMSNCRKKSSESCMVIKYAGIEGNNTYTYNDSKKLTVLDGHRGGDWRTYHTYEYSYNSKGNRTKVAVSGSGPRGEKSNNIWLYHYNTSDVLEKITSAYSNQTRGGYSEGNIAFTLLYDDDRLVGYQRKNTKDSLDQISEVLFSDFKKGNYHKCEHFYIKNGHRVRTSHEVAAFDNRENPFKKTQPDILPSFENLCKNNWVTKEEYTRDKLETETEREFKYRKGVPICYIFEGPYEDIESTYEYEMID